jgi:flagellar hook-basal body complex protein FliE
MNREPIEREAWDAIRRGAHALEDDLSKLTGHGRYHQQQAPASPAATEAPVSLTQTLKNDAEEVRADAKAAADKVEAFLSSKLPDALGDVEKLEGNPVAEALLSALHVPADALQGVVEVINTLAKAFPKTAADTATSEPTADVPQPVAAGPVVAGQA